MPEVIEKGVNASATNVTVTTTTEEVAVSSGRVPVSLATALILIKAWLQLTTGAGTTTVTLRVRRGTTTAGASVGESNAITIGAAAGSTEQFQIVVAEERADVESVEYSVTVLQAGATGNGTILQSAIEVEVLNG